VATAHAAEAKRFYGTTLGLTLVEDTRYALVFQTGANSLRVQKVQSVTTPPYTVIGWAVDDMNSTVTALTGNGVTFERFPGLAQDPAGVWTTPDGSKVAWFRDPDGNLLSITEHATP